MSTTFSKKSKNLFFSSDVTVFSLHEQHGASLNFGFRTHIILAKMYLGTFSRRARSLATCLCFARVRIIGTLVPFCVIGNSKEFPITQKTVIHFCTTVSFIYLQNCTLNFFYFLSFILLGNNFLLPILNHNLLVKPSTD